VFTLYQALGTSGEALKTKTRWTLIKADAR
jgi:hypothetical protein